MAAVLPYILVSIGLVLLYYGAEQVVGASSKLAIRLGVTPLMVGLTVVAFGTSAPELVVSIDSCLLGAGNISIGNVIGSNICNIALILGVSALICPMAVSRQLFRFDIPACLAASLLACAFLSNGGEMKIWEGVVLLAIFAGYIAYSIVTAKRKAGICGGNTAASRNGAIDGESGGAADGGAVPASVPEKREHIAKNVFFIALGLALLVTGANILVKGAVELATRWGVSEAVVGLTIVAVGTSLPELATSAVAALKKHNEIAIGNIIGSNLFNLLLILGVTGVLGPTTAAGILPRDVVLMVALAAALWLPLATGRVMPRWLGGALAGTYIVYMTILCLGVASA